MPLHRIESGGNEEKYDERHNCWSTGNGDPSLVYICRLPSEKGNNWWKMRRPITFDRSCSDVPEAA